MKVFFKYLLVIFFIINIKVCYCQKYVKYIPAYYDIGITEKLMDSLNTQNVNTFFLYLTTIYNNDINKSFREDERVEVTYFIWRQDGKTYAKLITDSCIYETLSISNNYIFKYPKFKNLWLTNDEDIYQFICPINSPHNKDIVIYIKDKSKRFFEIGENAYYELKPSKNKYRIEFVSLLNQALLSTKQKWIKQSNYDRWVDFPEKNNH